MTDGPGRNDAQDVPADRRDMGVCEGPSRPSPGSDAALDAGCTCPVLDNHHGAGFRIFGEQSWWINGLCPLHGRGKPDEHMISEDRLR